MKTQKITVNEITKILKSRPSDSHKGTMGTVNAVVGCSRYRGAAVLSVMGALRAGAGIVRLCGTEKVCAAVAAQYPSATLLPLGENAEGYISADSVSEIINAVKPTDVLLIGCGLGQCADTANTVNRLIFGLKNKKVIDADALNLLVSSDSLSVAKNVGALKNCIATPHIGEISRLCGKPISEISDSMESAAQEFSETYGCVTVLKSHRTVIAAPGDGNIDVYVSELGNTGLARGGSGDVLAGIIAGFLAQGYTLSESAVLGVAVHGSAADLCASERSMQAMLPSDLGEYICRLFSTLENGNLLPRSHTLADGGPLFRTKN